MLDFKYLVPTEIIFGRGAEESLAEMIVKYGGSRVAVVYGEGSAIKSGLIAKTESKLKSSGISYFLFGGVKPNPHLEHAREGIKKALEHKADMVVAVGGGSAIDTAKAIAHGAANPGADIWKIWRGEQTIAATLPVGVALTIPAAGSETSNSAVLTNKATGEKRGFLTELNRPKFALLNPELAQTLPKYQIACGIVDIFMHTLDRYFMKSDENEFTTEIAEALMRVVIANGKKAVESDADGLYQPMSELMWAGSVSHNGLTGLGCVPDFSVHQLGHELSGMFDIAHGASLSIMWGAWARYVLSEKPRRFDRYAKKVWDAPGAERGVEKTEEFFASLGMPVKFSDAPFGIQPDETIGELALKCSFFDSRTVGQFKKLTKEDLSSIYKSANR
ncbi:MAG: iron-containing alcohol dehydrogenase [Defluviitaleaceae bacterium]|nr:iron-containing alcohol dehydrogenase [Defluviitaleaceae bacterium]